MGEKLSSAEFRDRIEVRRHGRPLYLDGVRLSGDLTRALSSDVTAGGAGAVASLLYVAQDAGSHLGALRAMLPPTGGASLLAPDVLALRCLAPDSFELRRALLPILDRLTGHTLPTSWRL